MARPSKNREINIFHLSFFNLLFGAFGAFVFLMVMQMLASTNLIDADARRIVDETVREKEQLKQELLKYQRLDQTLGDAQALRQQLQAERDRLGAERDAIRAQNQRLRADLDALQQRSSAARGPQRQETGDTLRALEQSRRELEQSLEQAERKLATLKALPLWIKTRALPTTLTEENVQVALAVEGGSPPYRWELKGALPPGLSLDPDTGLIAGVTQSPGDFQFALKVTDAQNSDAETQTPVTFKVIRKSGEQSHRVPDWSLIAAGALALFFVYKFWQGHRARRKMKEMEAQGFQLRWIKEPRSNPTLSTHWLTS
ncbi:MAG: putative Ig domain-containing protein [Candidatus Contendobacter sp.]|nr:putative Ig domain-containing protein [Candidatus Contendobacter sp.]